MNVELLLFGFGCGVAGIVIGLVVANIFRADNELFHKIKTELEETKEKLKRQTEHFAESENMMHKLGTDLKNLYQHMSQNEISTLKEKFKGLVIDADASLDKLVHKDKEAEEKPEQVEVAETLEEGNEKPEVETEEESKNDAAVEEVDTKEVAVEEVVDEIVESTVETSDGIKEKINETIDELAGKNKKD